MGQNGALTGLKSLSVSHCPLPLSPGAQEVGPCARDQLTNPSCKDFPFFANRHMAFGFRCAWGSVPSPLCQDAVQAQGPGRPLLPDPVLLLAGPLASESSSAAQEAEAEP